MKHLFFITSLGSCLLFAVQVMAQTKVDFSSTMTENKLIPSTKQQTRVLVKADDKLVTQVQIDKVSTPRVKFWSKLIGSIGMGIAANRIPLTYSERTSVNTANYSISLAVLPSLAIAQRPSSSKVYLQVSLFDNQGNLQQVREVSSSLRKRHFQFKIEAPVSRDGYAEITLFNKSKASINTFITTNFLGKNIVKPSPDQLDYYREPVTDLNEVVVTAPYLSSDGYYYNGNGGFYGNSGYASSPGGGGGGGGGTGGTSGGTGTDDPVAVPKDRYRDYANKCEYDFAVAHPIASNAAKNIATRVEALFRNNTTLLAMGGNKDDTKANALKHCIWNMLMVCSTDIGLGLTKSIAYNHEVCEGQRLTPLPQYEMDTFNNARGQEMGENLRSQGLCNESYVINTAIQAADLLKWIE